MFSNRSPDPTQTAVVNDVASVAVDLDLRRYNVRWSDGVERQAPATGSASGACEADACPAGWVRGWGLRGASA